MKWICSSPRSTHKTWDGRQTPVSIRRTILFTENTAKRMVPYILLRQVIPIYLIWMRKLLQRMVLETKLIQNSKHHLKKPNNGKRNIIKPRKSLIVNYLKIWTIEISMVMISPVNTETRVTVALATPFHLHK